MKRIIFWLLHPRWIVNDAGELGIRVLGVNLWYYKWPEPMLADYGWRYAEKREFGECVKSVRTLAKAAVSN